MSEQETSVNRPTDELLGLYAGLSFDKILGLGETEVVDPSTGLAKTASREVAKDLATEIIPSDLSRVPEESSLRKVFIAEMDKDTNAYSRFRIVFTPAGGAPLSPEGELELYLSYCSTILASCLEKTTELEVAKEDGSLVKVKAFNLFTSLAGIDLKENIKVNKIERNKKEQTITRTTGTSLILSKFDIVGKYLIPKETIREQLYDAVRMFIAGIFCQSWRRGQIVLGSQLSRKSRNASYEDKVEMAKDILLGHITTAGKMTSELVADPEKLDHMIGKFKTDPLGKGGKSSNSYVDVFFTIEYESRTSAYGKLRKGLSAVIEKTEAAYFNAQKETPEHLISKDAEGVQDSDDSEHILNKNYLRIMHLANEGAVPPYLRYDSEIRENTQEATVGQLLKRVSTLPKRGGAQKVGVLIGASGDFRKVFETVLGNSYMSSASGRIGSKEVEDFLGSAYKKGREEDSVVPNIAVIPPVVFYSSSSPAVSRSKFITLAVGPESSVEFVAGKAIRVTLQALSRGNGVGFHQELKVKVSDDDDEASWDRFYDEPSAAIHGVNNPYREDKGLNEFEKRGVHFGHFFVESILKGGTAASKAIVDGAMGAIRTQSIDKPVSSKKGGAAARMEEILDSGKLEDLTTAVNSVAKLDTAEDGTIGAEVNEELLNEMTLASLEKLDPATAIQKFGSKNRFVLYKLLDHLNRYSEGSLSSRNAGITKINQALYKGTGSVVRDMNGLIDIIVDNSGLNPIYQQLSVGSKSLAAEGGPDELLSNLIMSQEFAKYLLERIVDDSMIASLDDEVAFNRFCVLAFGDFMDCRMKNLIPIFIQRALVDAETNPGKEPILSSTLKDFSSNILAANLRGVFASIQGITNEIRGKVLESDASEEESTKKAIGIYQNVSKHLISLNEAISEMLKADGFLAEKLDISSNLTEEDLDEMQEENLLEDLDEDEISEIKDSLQDTKGLKKKFEDAIKKAASSGLVPIDPLLFNGDVSYNFDKYPDFKGRSLQSLVKEFRILAESISLEVSSLLDREESVLSAELSGGLNQDFVVKASAAARKSRPLDLRVVGIKGYATNPTSEEEVDQCFGLVHAIVEEAEELSRKPAEALRSFKGDDIAPYRSIFIRCFEGVEGLDSGDNAKLRALKALDNKTFGADSSTGVILGLLMSWSGVTADEIKKAAEASGVSVDISGVPSFPSNLSGKSLEKKIAEALDRMGKGEPISPEKDDAKNQELVTAFKAGLGAVSSVLNRTGSPFITRERSLAKDNILVSKSAQKATIGKILGLTDPSFTSADNHYGSEAESVCATYLNFIRFIIDNDIGEVNYKDKTDVEQYITLLNKGAEAWEELENNSKPVMAFEVLHRLAAAGDKWSPVLSAKKLRKVLSGAFYKTSAIQELKESDPKLLSSVSKALNSVAVAHSKLLDARSSWDLDNALAVLQDAGIALELNGTRASRSDIHRLSSMYGIKMSVDAHTGGVLVDLGKDNYQELQGKIGEGTPAQLTYRLKKLINRKARNMVTHWISQGGDRTNNLKEVANGLLSKVMKTISKSLPRIEVGTTVKATTIDPTPRAWFKAVNKNMKSVHAIPGMVEWLSGTKTIALSRKKEASLVQVTEALEDFINCVVAANPAAAEKLLFNNDLEESKLVELSDKLISTFSYVDKKEGVGFISEATILVPIEIEDGEPKVPDELKPKDLKHKYLNSALAASWSSVSGLDLESSVTYNPGLKTFTVKVTSTDGVVGDPASFLTAELVPYKATSPEKEKGE